MKKTIAILLALCLCVGLCACDASEYKKAVALYSNGDFNAAHDIFVSLGEYKDSAVYVNRCKYDMAMALMNEADYEAALKLFEELGEYENSNEQIVECNYQLALALLENKDYSNAIVKLNGLGEYKDSLLLVTSAKWDLLYQYIKDNNGSIEFGVGSSSAQKLCMKANDNGSITLEYASSHLILTLHAQTLHQLTLRKGDKQAEYKVGALINSNSTIVETVISTIDVASFSSKLSMENGSFTQTVTKPNGSQEIKFQYEDSLVFYFTLESDLNAICENLPLMLEKTDLDITAADLGFAFE